MTKLTAKLSAHLLDEVLQVADSGATDEQSLEKVLKAACPKLRHVDYDDASESVTLEFEDGDVIEALVRAGLAELEDPPMGFRG
jgi:hypothetical protein